MRRQRTAILALFLGGCVTTSPVPPVNPVPVEPPVARARELPPGKAAEVCWAAAEEMRKSGLAAEAIAEYEKVRQHDPHHGRVAWRLALLYDRQGNAVRANEEYQRALEAEPKNPDLLSDRGYFYYQRGDHAQAEKWFREALAIDAGHRRATINLALTLGHQGRIEDSLAQFSRVLPPAQAYCNVGVLLANQGQREQARHYFLEALRLDMTLSQARTFLGFLDAPPAPGDGLTP
jgi:Tfp pilus assembly protein PilF